MRIFYWAPLNALLLSLLLLPGIVQAQEIAGVAKVMSNQLGALTRNSPRGAMEPATVYFRGKALRIEFQDRAGNGLAVVLPGNGAAGWVQADAGGVAPLPDAGWSLLVNPSEPCAGGGLFADCAALGEAMVAGRTAKHWRYRFSNATGPGRTRSGEMWVDVETGFVLGYKSSSGAKQQWQVRKIHYAPQPEALFMPPAASASTTR